MRVCLRYILTVASVLSIPDSGQAQTIGEWTGCIEEVRLGDTRATSTLGRGLTYMGFLLVGFGPNAGGAKQLLRPYLEADGSYSLLIGTLEPGNSFGGHRAGEAEEIDFYAEVLSVAAAQGRPVKIFYSLQFRPPPPSSYRVTFVQVLATQRCGW